MDIRPQEQPGSDSRKIAVIGLGHAGLPTAVGLSSLGWKVLGADEDTAKVGQIMSGKSPSFEPGLDELLKESLARGNFHAVSPYASFLGLAIDPQQAVRNLQRLRYTGCLGKFGFYDAVDFRNSLPSSRENFQVVRCWMAHHEGMSLVATCNLLTDGSIQNLFHAEPAVCAAELLLHEKYTPVFGRPRVGGRQGVLHEANLQAGKLANALKNFHPPRRGAHLSNLDLSTCFPQMKSGSWSPGRIPPSTSARD